MNEIVTGDTKFILNHAAHAAAAFENCRRELEKRNISGSFNISLMSSGGIQTGSLKLAWKISGYLRPEGGESASYEVSGAILSDCTKELIRRCAGDAQRAPVLISYDGDVSVPASPASPEEDIPF